MWREPAIRVDLVRGKRQHGLLGRVRGQPFEGADEELDVGDGLLDVGVTRDDRQHHAVRQRLRGGGHKQRLGGRGQARHRARGGIHARPRDGGFQQSSEIQ